MKLLKPLRIILLTFLICLGFNIPSAKAEVDQSQPHANYETGVKLFLEGNYENSAQAFLSALEGSAYDGITYFNIGVCYLYLLQEGVQKENPDAAAKYLSKAEEFFTQSTRMLPFFPQAFSNLAMVYFKQNKPDDVIRQKEGFAQILSDNLGAFSPDINNSIYAYKGYSARMAVAENYFGADDCASSKNELLEVISQMEKSPPANKYLHYTAYNTLAHCLYQDKKFDEALSAMENSLRVAPDQPNLDVSYSNLAVIYFEKKDFSAAQKYVDAALKIDSANETALEYQDRLKEALRE